MTKRYKAPYPRSETSATQQHCTLTRNAATRTDGYDPSPAESSTEEWEDSETTHQFSDIVTPGYKGIIDRGGIVNNPCVISGTELKVGQCFWSMDKHDGSGYNHSGQGHLLSKHRLGGSIGFLSASPNGNVRDAKLAALQDIDSTPYEFGEDALSIKETLRFLRNPLLGLRRLSTAFRKETSHLNSAKAFANAYTEYRFAVSPLVRTAYDLVEAHNATPEIPPERRTARGFSFGNESKSESETLGHFIYDHNVVADERIHASILYQVSNPIYGSQWKHGLRGKDFPKTLWQIMPYSFMIDRLVDISSAIGAITNLSDPSVEILAASVSSKRTSTSTITLRGNPEELADRYTMTAGGQDSYESSSYSRSVWHPGLSDAIPRNKGWDAVDSVTKTTDLIALIVSNFKGKKKQQTAQKIRVSQRDSFDGLPWF